MANIISCRVGAFASLDDAFACLPQAGIVHVEVGPPRDGNYHALGEQAAKAGITIATLSGHLRVGTEEEMKGFWPMIDGAAALGVAKVFVSARAADSVPRPTVISRLRAAAQYAQDRGVTVCMETHPPFGTNGDVARATISEVNHPALRFNFDTANIYYYNHETDSVRELRKVADLVASVHIKDTDGGYRSLNFPVVGTGVVDFPAVFKILGEIGFTGPYTLELEGPLVDGVEREKRLDIVRRCVDYLRKIKAMA